MSLHKLSAGDGYTYLTRQVAAADDTNRGHGSLGAYYEQKGESPGVWLGRGLDSLDGRMPEFRVSGVVTEAQMTALFGEGRHPNADVIERNLQREGVGGRALDRATKLGQEYRVYDANPFRERLAARYRELDALGVAAESVLGPTNLARMEQTVESITPGSPTARPGRHCGRG